MTNFWLLVDTEIIRCERRADLARELGYRWLAELIDWARREYRGQGGYSLREFVRVVVAARLDAMLDTRAGAP